MPPLQRTQARARAGLVRPTAYRVVLDLGDDASGFGSTTTIRFTARAGAEAWLEIRPQQLNSAVLNGREIDLDDAYSPVDGRLTLSGLAERNEVVVDALMSYSHDGEGMVRHVDPADGRVYLYAMSFLDAAPRWFACLDQPDLKAPLRLEIGCPPGWTVAGNGPAVRVGAGRWTIDQQHPLATYCATLIAGPYHSVRGEHGGIPLVLHARASLAAELERDAPALLRHTAGCLDRFADLFGSPYPWGEYHQAFVPDFNAWAMENPGCVTLRDQLLFRSGTTDGELIARDSTVAHEMAHMWFGDLVTMRWWDDLWLNESFAEYLGHRVCAELGEGRAWTSFGIERKAWGYRADRRPSTHPVAGNGAPDTAAALADFDGISYAKGAAVLRQLATHLGDDVFLAGLRSYLARFAFGNAELADLLAEWSAAGGADVAGWAAQWLRTPGLDTLRVDGAAIRRETPPAHPAEREHVITVAGYAADGSVSRVPLRLATELTPLPGSLRGFVLPDAGDQSWVKVALPPDAATGLRSLLPRLEPDARVAVWNAVRLAVDDAELDPAAVPGLVASAVPGEQDDSILTTVLDWATATVVPAFVPEAARAEAFTVLARAAGQALDTAAPGSGRQRAALRAVLELSTATERLRALLAGAAPAGMTVDSDLRWRALARLCALGAAGDAEIEAAAAADPTTEGAEHAATCRALLPHPAAKAAAWAMLMSDTDCSNSMLYATARGFWHPLQRDVTAPFVPRYFAEIAATARFRSGWVVSRLAGLAYPHHAVSRGTLEATDALLGRRDLEPGLRRSVADAGDDLRRAVVARERFG